ncbi:nucleoside deaminase [Mucisphaera calidilacus]|uniref:Guanine deaminase n=1 Tax=Mucisphaera calidilacus TaxID=2527982 RepID=A0A518C0I9_9BACT|nr:nucleoside deaminase [Mucisphaera calidilacus]QDU72733.1 Guanine deaminase [Mucisphaera calidilacus]
MTFSPRDCELMQQALDACEQGIHHGQSPFGALIERDDQVLVATHNHVRAQSDPTAHAEVCAIRHACGHLNTIHLESATIYSTTEPCPMCFTAIHWARIRRIVFGASIADAARFGFNELPVSDSQLKQLGQSPVMVEGGCLADRAIDLFQRWHDRGGQPY